MTTKSKGKIFTVLDTYDLSGGDSASDPISSAAFDAVSVSVVQADVTGTTKTVAVKLQASADGVAWFDTDATNHTVTTADSAASSVGFAASDLVYPYLRCYADAHADVTGGDLTVKIWGHFR